MATQTILQAIESANAEAGITTFRLARIEEINAFIESFNFEEFPIHIIVPYEVRPTFSQFGRVPTRLSLVGFVMTRYAGDIEDLRSPEAEANYFSPMRKLANTFLKELLLTDIIDPQTDDATATIRPEVNFLDLQAIGVGYNAEIPILSGVC